VTELLKLRIASLAEGVSYALLLGVAMPLKYAYGMPNAVPVIARIHGALFVLLAIALGRCAVAQGWRTRRVLEVLVAAVVPLGAFVLERSLAREARADAQLSPQRDAPPAP